MPTVWWAFTVLNKREEGNNSSEVSILATLCGECVVIYRLVSNLFQYYGKLEASMCRDRWRLIMFQSGG